VDASICLAIAHAATLGRQLFDGWETVGDDGDRLQYVTLECDGETLTLVRDDNVNHSTLVFTSREWDAFKDGVSKGEFNVEMGLSPFGVNGKEIS
jgi:hypothetical protein